MKRCQDLDKTQALWVLGLMLREQLPTAALRAINEGNESPSMLVLVGLTNAEIDEASMLFERALTELGRRSLAKDEALRTLGCCIAWEIKEAQVDAYEGAKLLWRAKVASELLHRHQLDPFVYAASEYEDRPGDRAFFTQAIVQAAKEYLRTHCG